MTHDNQLTDDAEESPLKFPCEFPIKAMGRTSADPDLEIQVVSIVRRHARDLGEGALQSRLSSGGRYISVTVTVRATSREQLDAIYQDLTACDDIMVVL